MDYHKSRIRPIKFQVNPCIRWPKTIPPYKWGVTDFSTFRVWFYTFHAKILQSHASRMLFRTVIRTKIYTKTMTVKESGCLCTDCSVEPILVKRMYVYLNLMSVVIFLYAVADCVMNSFKIPLNFLRNHMTADSYFIHQKKLPGSVARRD